MYGSTTFNAAAVAAAASNALPPARRIAAPAWAACGCAAATMPRSDETLGRLPSMLPPPDQPASTPATAPLMQVASVPDRIERMPSATTSCRRSGTMTPSPPIMIPRLPKFAKPHNA